MVVVSLISLIEGDDWWIYEHDLTTKDLNDLDGYCFGACGDDGVLLHTDYPISDIEEWWSVPLPTTENLFSVFDPWEGPIVGASGTIIVKESGDWIIAETHTGKDLYSAYSGIDYKGDSGFIVGEDGTILFYNPNDRTKWFLYEPTPAQSDIYSIHKIYSNPEKAWAVGEGGTILLYENQEWKLHPGSPTSEDLLFVYVDQDTHTGWACGRNGTILKCDDRENWTLIDTPTTQDLYSICRVDYEDVFLLCVGANGTIMKSSDSGMNWEFEDSPVSVDLYAVGDFLSIVWAVGEEGTIIGRGHIQGNIETRSLGMIKSLFGEDVNETKMDLKDSFKESKIKVSSE
jgi:hypothetical protein